MVRYIRHIIICTCAWGILSLMGCSGDSVDGKEQMTTHELHLSLGTHQFDATRASDNLPVGFEDYEQSAALAKILRIQGYMTYENTEVSCTFTPDASTWTSMVSLKPSETYYLYGFMPKENLFVSNGNISIAPYNNTSYEKGAVLTFNGLNTVVAGDFCTFVGVKGYGISLTSVPDMKSRLGKFDYTPDAEGNSIYLLVDHIYAGLKFSMTLDATYAQLRDIKVKRVNLIPIPEEDNNVIVSVDAVVTIVANNNNQNPMSVVFQNRVSGNKPKEATLYDGENGDGLSLSTDHPSFMACVMPKNNPGDKVNTKYTLETTYDVFDRKGNLIREDEKAQNAITLEYSNLDIGKLHTVNITVMPTYLYVLSDPDLDNPTFTVELTTTN